MAILDKFSELGESITNKSKTVVQKAKDATGIVGLNGRISELDSRCSELFEQLGRAYFEAKGGPATEEMANLVADISAAQEEQATIREQIKSIRGVVCCENCGKELPIGTGFCPECGAKVPEPVVKTCPGCGKIVSDDAAFCTSCGTKLN
jgi:rRNA maturation endonuclease Nob1